MIMYLTFLQENFNPVAHRTRSFREGKWEGGTGKRKAPKTKRNPKFDWKQTKQLQDIDESLADITDELIENVAQAIVSYIPKLSIEDAKNLLVIGSDIDTLEFLGYLFAFGKVSDADKKK